MKTGISNRIKMTCKIFENEPEYELYIWIAPINLPGDSIVVHSSLQTVRVAEIYCDTLDEASDKAHGQIGFYAHQGFVLSQDKEE